LAWSLFGLLAVSCTVKPPDIKITDEKTALEKQILGTYSEIQEDVWMVASVRSSEPGKKEELSKEKEAVLNAYQNREFNKDDIEEFKADGCIGENSKGYLEVRGSDKYSKENSIKKLVDQVVETENKDRTGHHAAHPGGE